MQSSYSRIRSSFVSPRVLALVSALAPFAAAFGACTDDGEGDLTTGDTSTSDTSATTGTGATTTASGSTTSTSSSSSSTGSGTGGQGGAGGCIDPSVAAASFSIQTGELCVVASYTAPDLTLAPFGVEPTWGRHHGPLTSTVVSGATDEVHVERWTISGSTLTKAETVISGITQIPANAFAGAQTVDLPFGNLTAVSWSGQSFTTDGGVLFLDTTHATTDFVATGVFGTAAFGTAASARVVYTGLSAFNGPTNDVVGLYAADFTNGTFGTSQAVASWGEATGPVAVDLEGNLLAVNTKFSDGTQEIRGFAASTVAAGQPPSAGQTLLTTDGFGSSLAAIAPTGTLPGLALFQPQTGPNGDYDDVEVLRYSVGSAKVTTISSEPMLKLTTANTNLTLMTDDQGRVWVGAPAATGSVFYVLDRP